MSSLTKISRLMIPLSTSTRPLSIVVLPWRQASPGGADESTTDTPEHLVIGRRGQGLTSTDGPRHASSRRVVSFYFGTAVATGGSLRDHHAALTWRTCHGRRSERDHEGALALGDRRRAIGRGRSGRVLPAAAIRLAPWPG